MDTHAQIETKLVPAEPTFVVVDYNRSPRLEAEIERQGFTISKSYLISKWLDFERHPEEAPNGWTWEDVYHILDKTFGDLRDAGLEPGVIEVNATPESVVALDREIIRKRLGAVMGGIGEFSENDLATLRLDGVDEETLRDVEEQIKESRKKRRKDSDYMEDSGEPDEL